jgi:outer membrane protein
MIGTVRLASFILPAAVAALAAPALAQGDAPAGWTVSVGPGAAYVPTFPGSDEHEIRFWPVIDVRRTGTEAEFETPDDSFGFGIVGNRSFRAGPSINIQSGRQEEDAIIGIGDVGTTVEGGVFAETFLADQFRLRADARKGFGGHKGVVVDIGADAIAGRTSDRFHASIGPRLRFANGRYVRAFYGVNPNQSSLTGLPVYDAGGGFHSAGVLAFASYKLNRSLAVQSYARYDRLVGDAAKSPLVLSEAGSRNQYEGGLGLSYSFNTGS